jgi:hypothetical protein
MRKEFGWQDFHVQLGLDGHRRDETTVRYPLQIAGSMSSADPRAHIHNDSRSEDVR